MCAPQEYKLWFLVDPSRFSMQHGAGGQVTHVYYPPSEKRDMIAVKNALAAMFSGELKVRFEVASVVPLIKSCVLPQL